MTNEVKPMRLIDAPAGLLECNGTIIMKTNYMTRHTDESVTPDCYIVESGEYFCGGVETAEELQNLEVKPVCFDATSNIYLESWTAEWKRNYRSGVHAGNGYVCSKCDMWNNRPSWFCPSCGKAMKPEAWAEL